MLLFSELFSSHALFSGLYRGFTFYGKAENTGGTVCLYYLTAVSTPVKHCMLLLFDPMKFMNFNFKSHPLGKHQCK